MKSDTLVATLDSRAGYDTVVFDRTLSKFLGKGFFNALDTQIRQHVRENDERRFEQNRRFEEMTDLAERIGYPIDTNIYYDLRGESLYARTDTRQRAFIEQTHQAKAEAEQLFTGDQSFEIIRRSHEHDEAIMVEQLARGELGGNVLVKVSKVPDAVVAGKTSIKGYKRESLRTFVRMYHRDDGVVRCRLFSLDQNNSEGFTRLGDMYGMRLTGRSSEEILADGALYDVLDPEAFVDELADRSIVTYDTAVFETSGRRTFAGSKYETRQNAQQIVEGQPGLLREHFIAISEIAGMSISTSQKDSLFEIERQRTAAAIALSARGVSITSTGDGAVSAEVANGDYGRECATGTENGMQQGQSDGKEIAMTCPYCGLTTYGDPCAFRLVCGRCDAEVRGGKVISKGVGRAAALARSKKTTSRRSSSDASHQPPQVSNEALLRMMYGEDAVMTSRVVLGGMQYDVINKRNNEVIATVSNDLT